jgi:uncharacterized membrane protein
MQREGESGSTTFMGLFLIGFFLIFAGIIVLIFAAMPQGNTGASSAVVIFVGPIPIVLGAGPQAFLAILLAVILTIIGFVIFFLMRKTRV